MSQIDFIYRWGKSLSLVMPRPPAPRGWFDPSRVGGSKTRVLAKHVLAWRELVAHRVDEAGRPQLIGTVIMRINFANGDPGLDAHARRAVVDVMRCCRVIANQDQVIIDGVEAASVLLDAGEVRVVVIERMLPGGAR